MREVERSAASVEEAIEAALEELGISEQEAEVEIVKESRGLLGLGSKGATVRVRARGDSAPAEQADFALEFVTGLIDRMDLRADVELNEVDGTTYVDILGTGRGEDEMGILIGRHGQTLESIQDILRGAVQRKTGDRCRIVVDVEDYRKRRRAQLVERAHDAAERARKTGKPQRLEPMSPYERKIVHDAVAGVGGMESASEGEEPERRVVITKRGRGST